MKWATVPFAVLLVAGNLRADVGPLPGSKHVKAIHRIEVEHEFPDYVFLLVREGWSDKRRGYAVEPEFVELAPGKPFVFRLTGYVPGGEEDGWQRASLRVAKRGTLRPNMSPQEVYEVHADCLEWFDYREMVPSWAGNEEPTLTHRVQRAQSGEGLELVQTGRSPMFQWKIAVGLIAVALSVACVLGGIRLIRTVLRTRMLPKPSPPPSTP